MSTQNESSKLIVKNIILLGIPILVAILSVFCSLLLGEDGLKVWFGVCISGVIILGIFYICAIIYYSRDEKGKEARIQALESKLKNLEEEYKNIQREYKESQEVNQLKIKVLSYIVATFKETVRGYSVNINDIANDIIDRGIAEKKDWNVGQLCDTICKSCCELVKTIAKSSTDISVGYISKYERDKEIYVNMIAHSDVTKPNVYKSEELLNECNYYYASIIKSNNPQYKAFATKDEILRHFRARHDDTDLNKYSQYIAVPVMCDANKLIGVLQIVIKNGLRLRESNDELIALAEAYIAPYVSLIVLIHKLDKGLFAIPQLGKEDI